MTAEAPGRRSLTGIVGSGFVVLSCTLLIFLSVWYYRADRAKRVPVETFFRRFHFPERRPELVRAARVAPTADMAAEVGVDAVVLDALGSTTMQGLDPQTRQLWMEMLKSLDGELAAAQLLSIDALRARPGWPRLRRLAGQIEFARARRALKLGVDPERWLRPLELSMVGAPGDRSSAGFTGGAILQAWPFLAQREPRRVRSILREALQEPSFVALRFDDVREVLGDADANELLPDSAQCLRAAIRSDIEGRNVAGAAALYPRWERAELKARESDLLEVVARARLGDVVGVRAACRAWAREHPVFEFDRSEARRQAARVLESWPDDTGSWRRDRRAEYVRFFLDRPWEVDGEAVARAASTLDGIPPSVLARTAVMGGDLYRAARIAQASDALGTFEWTRFQVDLARAHLRAGNQAEAAEALALISPAAQDECDVVVARAFVRNSDTAPEIPTTVFSEKYGPESWSRSQLPICVDPQRGFRELLVDVEVANAPALVSVGFDLGRLATFALPVGRATIRASLGGRSGRHVFSFRVETGGEVKPLTASLR